QKTVGTQVNYGEWAHMSNSKFHLTKMISLALATAGGMAISSSTLAQDNESNSLEEIVVTAQKREQSLEEIPMSITVLGGTLLERQQAFDFEDMVALIPGFSITGSTPGITRIT